MGKLHTKLNQTERELISQWKRGGVSNRKCAQRLGRHVATVGREIRHNRCLTEREDEFGEKEFLTIYEPLHAQYRAEVKKKKAWQAKHPLKNKDTYAYVLEKLREGWSPEQISGRLKLKYPNNLHWHICHETIYRYVYQPGNQDLRLWEYLRRKQKRRRKRNGRKRHRCRIPDRVSIHQRPKVIEKRKQIGHWEGDTLEGKGRTNGLHTTYERVSSLTKMQKMARLTSEESINAQLKIYRSLPAGTTRSTTLDNGKEHVKHLKLKEELGMPTYFADPYSLNGP